MVVAEGELADVAQLRALLEDPPSTSKRPGEVRTVVPQYSEPRGATGFEER